MTLFPQLSSQLISLAAIGVYLTAAFLPCEPTAEQRSAIATSLAASEIHAFASPVERTSARPLRPAEAAPAHDHSAHGHGHGAGAGDRDPAPNAKSMARAKAADDSNVSLVLKAKCICGCDRTRSQVGGGAARLGSVVFVSASTGLPPAPVVVAEDRVLARWVEVYCDDDLVPI